MTDYPPSAPINEILKGAQPDPRPEIVGELRKWATIYRNTYGEQICTRAADEIERLRAMVPPEPPLGEYGEVSDGFGSVWLLCKPDCGIQVVRPGKAQCECDFKEDE